VVVDHDKIRQAKAVEPWVAKHPRLERLCLPTSCPPVHLIERAFGAVQDYCPRDHRRKRWRDLVADVVEHRHVHGPGQTNFPTSTTKQRSPR
jgi:hypothetical protein